MTIPSLKNWKAYGKMFRPTRLINVVHVYDIGSIVVSLYGRKYGSTDVIKTRGIRSLMTWNFSKLELVLPARPHCKESIVNRDFTRLASIHEIIWNELILTFNLLETRFQLFSIINGG